MENQSNSNRDAIEFYRPVNTVSISVTGSDCSLNCAHCGKQHLKNMIPIENAKRFVEKKAPKSCLISGGCNTEGEVDFYNKKEIIKEIKRECRINLHTGFVDDNTLSRVEEIADVVSFDIPASDSVINNVYGLKYHVGDYINAYKKLKARIKTVPHLCIGLQEGVESEIEIIRELKEINPEALSLIIFIPTCNTRFEKRNPPDIDDALKVIKFAREQLENTKLMLGCMRPRGEYRDKLDQDAVQAGIDGIVMPAKSAVIKAEELGLKVIWKEECCSL